MIEYRRGNILEADAEALVNSVNCVGVMGRGIALQFKKAWPDNFKAYAKACERQEVRPGKMFVFETGSLVNPRYIINFPTKRHWRGKSRIEDIEAGLKALGEEIKRRNIRSIALPPLGCGLGGLNWADVRNLIEQILGNLTDVRIIVFEPMENQPLAKGTSKGKKSKMTPGRAVLIGLMYRYMQGLLAPFVSLLELHKLMYFMQETGEPLKLRFTKGPYGPYAENLRHVLNAMEGYYIIGYGTGGDKPNKILELLPGAVKDAQRVLENKPQTRNRYKKVSKLVEGFESPHGLELLATVHWIMTREHPLDFDDLAKRFYSWAERKHQFTQRQIKLALKVLKERNFL